MISEIMLVLNLIQLLFKCVHAVDIGVAFLEKAEVLTNQCLQKRARVMDEESASKAAVWMIVKQCSWVFIQSFSLS